jgi:hypothetical protein
MTDNKMVKGRNTEGQTMIYKTLCRKLKIKQQFNPVTSKIGNLT